MNDNQPKNVFNSDYYRKHLFAVFQAYPKTTFFIFANEYLFQFNEYWFHFFEYPYWWRKLLSAIVLVLMFKIVGWAMHTDHF
jgi:hypothetical protein